MNDRLGTRRIPIFVKNRAGDHATRVPHDTAIHNPVCGKNRIADYKPVQFDRTSKTRQSGKTAGEVDIYLIAKNRDKHFRKLQQSMHAWTQNQRIIRSKQEAKDLYDLMVASGRTDAETAATSLLNADWSKSAKLALADSR